MKLRLPDFKTIAHEFGPMHRPPLPPSRYTWYSFLLKAKSTARPQYDRKDYVNGNDEDTVGN